MFGGSFFPNLSYPRDGILEMFDKPVCLIMANSFHLNEMQRGSSGFLVIHNTPDFFNRENFIFLAVNNIHRDIHNYWRGFWVGQSGDGNGRREKRGILGRKIPGSDTSHAVSGNKNPGRVYVEVIQNLIH